jgi:uncharacterized protein YndB with AHSA1/START domain
MRGPPDKEEPMEGAVLEVTPSERIVFTNAFTVGWIPQKPFMVGLFELTPEAAAPQRWLQDAETRERAHRLSNAVRSTHRSMS